MNGSLANLRRQVVEALFPLILLAAWFVLQMWILPAMGFNT